MNKLMLIPPLVVSLLLVVPFAPIYPVTATKSDIECHPLDPCETIRTQESVVYDSTIAVAGNNFKWESKSQRLYLGLDYHQTITTYEANPYILGAFLLIPLLGFLIPYLTIQRKEKRGNGPGIE